MSAHELALPPVDRGVLLVVLGCFDLADALPLCLVCSLCHPLATQFTHGPGRRNRFSSDRNGAPDPAERDQGVDPRSFDRDRWPLRDPEDRMEAAVSAVVIPVVLRSHRAGGLGLGTSCMFLQESRGLGVVLASNDRSKVLRARCSQHIYVCASQRLPDPCQFAEQHPCGAFRPPTSLTDGPAHLVGIDRDCEVTLVLGGGWTRLINQFLVCDRIRGLGVTSLGPPVR